MLEELSLTLDPDAIVSTLSTAEQQMVEIAKAISIDLSLLIMDEPTAALGLTETKHLMELIRRLTAQGKAILYISHRLDEVFEIADRVTVLKDGRRVTTAPVSELKIGDVVRMMVGFEIGQHYPKEHNAQDRTCIEVDHLSTDNGVRDVSFAVNVGEVFGLGGMLGSGRTGSPARSMAWIELPAARFAWTAKRYGFAHRRRQSKASPTDPRKPKNGWQFPQLRRSTEHHDLQTRCAASGPLVESSPGTRDRVDLCQENEHLPHRDGTIGGVLIGRQPAEGDHRRWLFSEAGLLIMDEPTQGIDIGAKHEIYKVLNELTANGISILLISSDFPELLAMSDRVAVVRDGQILQITDVKDYPRSSSSLTLQALAWIPKPYRSSSSRRRSHGSDEEIPSKHNCRSHFCSATDKRVRRFGHAAVRASAEPHCYTPSIAGCR